MINYIDPVEEGWNSKKPGSPVSQVFCFLQVSHKQAWFTRKKQNRSDLVGAVSSVEVEPTLSTFIEGLQAIENYRGSIRGDG
jgi:hypothetical protein